MTKTIHKIIIGDSRSMAEIPDASVHLAVTSPPYWQLKDYDSRNQIGFDDSYENYVNHLNLVQKDHQNFRFPDQSIRKKQMMFINPTKKVFYSGVLLAYIYKS